LHTPDIKVITGIRRSGKSKLLEALRDYIENNISDANVIHINFNLVETEELKEYHALHSYIMDKHEAKADNFVLIDEIQMCDGFEHAINSLHASEMFKLAK
jgi:predicted AAA+ superfamily ATPase